MQKRISERKMNLSIILRILRAAVESLDAHSYGMNLLSCNISKNIKEGTAAANGARKGDIWFLISATGKLRSVFERWYFRSSCETGLRVFNGKSGMFSIRVWL